MRLLTRMHALANQVVGLLLIVSPYINRWGIAEDTGRTGDASALE